MNIQFIVKRSKKSFFDSSKKKETEDSTLYVIEVNPRSSRTIPFISKVTGVPMIDLAIKVIYGEKLSNLKYSIYI